MWSKLISFLLYQYFSRLLRMLLTSNSTVSRGSHTSSWIWIQLIINKAWILSSYYIITEYPSKMVKYLPLLNLLIYHSKMFNISPSEKIFMAHSYLKHKRIHLLKWILYFREHPWFLLTIPTFCTSGSHSCSSRNLIQPRRFPYLLF